MLQIIENETAPKLQWQCDNSHEQNTPFRKTSHLSAAEVVQIFRKVAKDGGKHLRHLKGQQITGTLFLLHILYSSETQPSSVRETFNTEVVGERKFANFALIVKITRV